VEVEVEVEGSLCSAVANDSSSGLPPTNQGHDFFPFSLILLPRHPHVGASRMGHWPAHSLVLIRGIGGVSVSLRTFSPFPGSNR